MEIHVTYILSEEGRKAAALAGAPAQSKQEICVKAEDLDADLLHKIVERDGVGSDGNVRVYISKSTVLGYKVMETLNRVSPKCWDRSSYFTSHTMGRDEGVPQFDKPMTIQELVEYREAHIAKMEAQRQQVAQELAKFAEADREARAKAEEAFAEFRRMQEDEKERNRKAEAEVMEEREAKREKEAQERNVWIQQHGSERLKLALELGMDGASNSVYLDERLAAEHPGFMFDKNWHQGSVEYKAAINPTLEELQALKDVKGKLPEARLQFAQLIEEDEYTGETSVAVREKVITAKFMGYLIVRRFTA